MSEDQFTKLFKYIEKRLDVIEDKLDQKADKVDVQRLIDTIDSFVKRIEDSDTEQAARDAQFVRLVEWARKVSEKTGVPLPNL